MKSRNWLVAMAALGVATFAAVSANATETLTYTGSDFTFATGDYSLTDSIAISVVLAMPLGDNFAGTVSPVSFSASDGVQTLSSGSGGVALEAAFKTNGAGQITDWDFDADNSTTGKSILTFNFNGDSEDYGTDCCGSQGFNSHDPGSWSISDVPEPATWAMMLVGLGGLGAAIRFSRRTDAVVAAAA